MGANIGHAIEPGRARMSQGSPPFAWGNALEEFALFRTLSSEQRLKAFRAMVRQDLIRGQMLVAQGDPSDSLFMVLPLYCPVGTRDPWGDGTAIRRSTLKCRKP